MIILIGYALTIISIALLLLNIDSRLNDIMEYLGIEEKQRIKKKKRKRK